MPRAAEESLAFLCETRVALHGLSVCHCSAAVFVSWWVIDGCPDVLENLEGLQLVAPPRPHMSWHRSDEHLTDDLNPSSFWHMYHLETRLWRMCFMVQAKGKDEEDGQVEWNARA